MSRQIAYGRVPPIDQVLVALLNNAADLQTAREAHWYRIPVRTAPKIAHSCRSLAFYQTKVFGTDGWAVNFIADVHKRETVTRLDLFPEQTHHSRAHERYLKLHLGEVRRLEKPIISRRGRRIVFIETTRAKFETARELNDLWHASPLEDTLWEMLKAERIEAERQVYEAVGGKNYCLDFALFCQNGRVDVECDGDTWHATPQQIPLDNARNNDLEKKGWAVLRFNGKQLTEDLPGCLRVIRETANRYGGLVTPEGELRYYAQGANRHEQLNLFQETPAEYAARRSEESQTLENETD